MKNSGLNTDSFWIIISRSMQFVVIFMFRVEKVWSWTLGAKSLELESCRLLIPRFFLFLILFFPMVGNAVNGFKLVCDSPRYDFGKIDQSAVITNAFTLRNEGDLSFVLKQVRSRCGCTVGRLNKQIIGPGETAKLTAIYTARRRMGLQYQGLFLIPVGSFNSAIAFYMTGFVEP